MHLQQRSWKLLLSNSEEVFGKSTDPSIIIGAQTVQKVIKIKNRSFDRCIKSGLKLSDNQLAVPYPFPGLCQFCMEMKWQVFLVHQECTDTDEAGRQIHRSMRIELDLPEQTDRANVPNETVFRQTKQTERSFS
jgi:hypothetical protein